MSPVKAEHWVSTRTAAQLLDVSPRTIARWVRTGQLSAAKVGRVWRIPYSEIRRLTDA